MKRHMAHITLAEVGGGVLRPLVRLCQKHPVLELAVHMSSELPQEGIGFGEVLTRGTFPFKQVGHGIQSKAIDAQQIAAWGSVQVDAALPQDAKVTVSTRTGNVATPADKTWSTWSEPQAVGDGFIKLASPAGRFMQYKLAFTLGQETATVDSVRVVYQVGNLAPEIIAIVAAPAQGGSADGEGPAAALPATPGQQAASPAGASQFVRTFTIRAADPNGDQLAYTVEYRQVGTPNWIKLEDKLEHPQYIWDTRTVADGKYEIRVTASDSPSNPPAQALTASKVSPVIVVDNTPPTISELAAKVEVPEIGPAAGATVSFSGKVADDSRILSMAYSLDSATDWVSVLPTDGICDSNREDFAGLMKDVKPGTHRLTIRVSDIFGNTGYKSVTVEVK